MWDVSSDAGGGAVDFCFLDVCREYGQHQSMPIEVFTLPINAENSVFKPVASTNASQEAVPEVPDMA